MDIPFTEARSVPLYSLRDVEKILAEGKQRVISIDGHHSIPPTKLARWKMTFWGELTLHDKNEFHILCMYN